MNLELTLQVRNVSPIPSNILVRLYLKGPLCVLCPSHTKVVVKYCLFFASARRMVAYSRIYLMTVITKNRSM